MTGRSSCYIIKVMDHIKKTILLVRHGTTTFNETDHLQGQIDNPLNQKGRDEAARLAAGTDIIGGLKNARNAAEIYALLMEKEKAILN